MEPELRCSRCNTKTTTYIEETVPTTPARGVLGSSQPVQGTATIITWDCPRCGASNRVIRGG